MQVVCACMYTQTCTQMRIKTQSSVFKMLLMAVILLLPEPTGSLRLICEMLAGIPTSQTHRISSASYF